MDVNEQLVESSEAGDLEAVKAFLDRGADLHFNSDDALQWAAMRGHLEVVRLLLDRGADIYTMNNFALRWAAGNGHLEVVRLLLDRGSDIHAENDDALRKAAEIGHPETVQFLLENGAYYNNLETRRFLEEILGVERLPSSREELIDMLKVAIIHKE